MQARKLRIWCRVYPYFKETQSGLHFPRVFLKFKVKITEEHAVSPDPLTPLTDP